MDKVGPETPAGPPSHSKVATPETLFDRWCEQTDVHGVSEFHDAKAVVAKGFWLAVVILGCSLAVNQSIELLLNYVMEDSWVTTMSTESAPGGQMRWPDIEICKITPTDLWMPGLERRGLTDPYDVAFVDYETRAGVLFYDQFQAEVPLTEAGINSTEQEYKERLNCTEPYPYCLQVGTVPAPCRYGHRGERSEAKRRVLCVSTYAERWPKSENATSGMKMLHWTLGLLFWH